MASQQIMARRRALALRRLMAAQERLAALVGVEVPAPQVTNRDSELAQIQETEVVASFLEKLEVKLGAGPAGEAQAAEKLEPAAVPRVRRAIARKGGA